MKAIILGDVHIGCRNDSQIFASYHISFFTDQLFPYMKKFKINHIIQLGDIFDRRKFVNFQILNQWKTKVFEYMKNNGITMDVILGNHDVYFRNTNDVSSPVLLLKEYDNVTPYIHPTEIMLDKTQCIYVPWINSSNLESTMKAVKDTDAVIAFGHFEFSGFEMDKGNKHEDGMETKNFNKFDSVYSGHFHHRSDNGHVFYVGIPYQMTWVDHGSIKGFHVWDSDTLKTEFIENPNQVFVRYVYDDAQDDTVKEDYVDGFDVSGIKDKYVKIVVLNKRNIYEFDRFMSRLYQQEPADIKIVETVQEEGPGTDKLDLESTKQILDSYVGSIENTTLDKKRLKKMLHSLYTEALNLETV